MAAVDPPGLSAAAAEQLTRQARAMWADGHFARAGAEQVVVGELLARAVDVHPGERVLDVAAGSGNAALAAARRGGRVTATDFVPALLEVAARRAEVEGLELDTQEADAQALPFADGSFDVVLSTFGVMFAPDQARAAAELLRVCRPGGRIGLTAWTPSSVTAATKLSSSAPDPHRRSPVCAPRTSGEPRAGSGSCSGPRMRASTRLSCRLTCARPPCRSRRLRPDAPRADQSDLRTARPPSTGRPNSRTRGLLPTVQPGHRRHPGCCSRLPTGGGDSNGLTAGSRSLRCCRASPSATVGWRPSWQWGGWARFHDLTDSTPSLSGCQPSFRQQSSSTTSAYAVRPRGDWPVRSHTVTAYPRCCRRPTR